MAQPFRFLFGTPDSQAFALAQTVASGGSLTLNGTYWPGIIPTGAVQVVGGFARVLTYFSGTDLSGVAIIVTGTGFARNTVLTETVSGPSVSPSSITGTTQFYSVSSVTISGGTATSLSIGVGGIGTGNWVLANQYADPFAIGLGVSVTGTVNYTAEYTYDNVQTNTSPTTFPIAALSGKTATLDSSLTAPVAAYRIKSNSGTGSFVFTAQQAG